MRTWIGLAVLGIALSGCKKDGWWENVFFPNKNVPTDPEPPPTDEPTETGPTGLVDTDVSTFTGDTATTHSNPYLDCSETWVSPAPGGTPFGACITELIDCDEVIEGNLADGFNLYDYDFWEAKGEKQSLSPGDLTGPERVLLFRNNTPGQILRVTIDSCVDMWASYVRHGDLTGSYCSLTDSNIVGHFEDGDFRHQMTTRPNTGSGTFDWEIIVDGYPNRSEGNFLVTVECL